MEETEERNSLMSAMLIVSDTEKMAEGRREGRRGGIEGLGVRASRLPGDRRGHIETSW